LRERCGEGEGERAHQEAVNLTYMNTSILCFMEKEKASKRKKDRILMSTFEHTRYKIYRGKGRQNTRNLMRTIIFQEKLLYRCKYKYICLDSYI